MKERAVARQRASDRQIGRFLTLGRLAQLKAKNYDTGAIKLTRAEKLLLNLHPVGKHDLHPEHTRNNSLHNKFKLKQMDHLHFGANMDDFRFRPVSKEVVVLPDVGLSVTVAARKRKNATKDLHILLDILGEQKTKSYRNVHDNSFGQSIAVPSATRLAAAKQLKSNVRGQSRGLLVNRKFSNIHNTRLDSPKHNGSRRARMPAICEERA